MAEPTTNEADASLSQAQTADPPKGQSGDVGQKESPETPRPSPETGSSSFQAVNAKAVAENASTSVNTVAQGSEASVPTPPPGNVAVTQNAPQIAQTSSEPSNASKPSSQLDGLDGAMSSDAATYGTRSRNRTGNARPNYAEDQDVELEYSSAATSSKKKPGNESATSAAQNATETKRAQDFARLIASNNAPANANGTSGKESTPGTPGTPGVPANLSKKRKAAGASTTLTQTPPASNSPAPAAMRKIPPPSTMARETNVMTFSKHRSCLNKKGELVADDGTKLCVNGKSNSPWKLLLLQVAAYPASNSTSTSGG